MQRFHWALGSELAKFVCQTQMPIEWELVGWREAIQIPCHCFQSFHLDCITPLTASVAWCDHIQHRNAWFKIFMWVESLQSWKMSPYLVLWIAIVLLWWYLFCCAGPGPFHLVDRQVQDYIQQFYRYRTADIIICTHARKHVSGAARMETAFAIPSEELKLTALICALADSAQMSDLECSYAWGTATVLQVRFSWKISNWYLRHSKRARPCLQACRASWALLLQLERHW